VVHEKEKIKSDTTIEEEPSISLITLVHWRKRSKTLSIDDIILGKEKLKS
jgi:hypothetical protein